MADQHTLATHRVLVVSNEQIAERMAGPAIRALNLARQLHARGAHVTVAMPREPDADTRTTLLRGLDVVTFGFPTGRRFRELARLGDTVITQPQRVDVMRALARTHARLIIDLYVPSYVERIAQLGTEPGARTLKTRLLERDRLEYATAIELGDAFICASARQRDHWLGALGQAGRLDLDLLTRDGALDQLVGIVPFGLPDEPPEPLSTRQPGLLRGSLVPHDAIVAVWTGGLWNWFDPVTVVEAVARARRRDPRLHLVVMGFRHPEPGWDEQQASRDMRQRAGELGLLADGGVVLCDEWVPYRDRHRFLLDADVAVSAHHDSLETRLSYRTRFLDHLWCALPTITTAGDALSTALSDAGAAFSVADGDVDAWEAALLEIARLPELRERMSDAARDRARHHRWSDVVTPLVDIVASATPLQRHTRRWHPLTAARAAALLVRIRAQAKGVSSLLRIGR